MEVQKNAVSKSGQEVAHTNEKKTQVNRQNPVLATGRPDVSKANFCEKIRISVYGVPLVKQQRWCYFFSMRVLFWERVRRANVLSKN